MQGVIFIDKPTGMTSFDVIRRLRVVTEIRKIGHAGTLDPFATGLLIICISRQATRCIDEFTQLDKTYTAILKLGEKTDTADIEGKIIEIKDVPDTVEQNIDDVFSLFLGEIDQVPPQFSAIKKDGVRLYKTARKGIQVEIEPRKVFIHTLSFLNYQEPYLEFSSTVSKGTYIRSLGEDIAAKLGTVGHLTELRRDAIGPFSVKDALSLEDITERALENSIKPIEEIISLVQKYKNERYS
ncbi:MAG TPA: tRNA pseudouridine(55) synthase TruB [Candidatus Cloacimonetes bacterium]|nr:tRNA pseudouridine(55) synthase TruB [Candidatus Cloacimonadota bacterium]